jgi:LuxR family transcriptional regulator, maltose regulon positive regulatory protein
VRVFADEGAPMAALLGGLIATQRTQQTAADGILLAYLGRAVRAFGPGTAATCPRGRAGTAVVGGLFAPLSDRELEVLRLLAAGESNQQIAEELVVALSTVKKHVAHILDKLGAANRTEATARARELGLLR